MKPLVLINSPELDFYLLLNHILSVDGFQSGLSKNSADTIAMALESRPLAIVLDCRPDQSLCAKTCAGLKKNEKTAHIPVAALIAPGAGGQHIGLLKAGVDQSFMRPFSPAKLLDYLSELLMQSGVIPVKRRTGLRRLLHDDVEMNLDTYRVTRNGQHIHLGPIEFQLLRHMLEKPGQVFSREELIKTAWPENVFVDPRTVDVHIGRLRKLLKSVADTDLIRTVRSAGYALMEANSN